MLTAVIERLIGIDVRPHLKYSLGLRETIGKNIEKARIGCVANHGHIISTCPRLRYNFLAKNRRAASADWYVGYGANPADCNDTRHHN